MPCKREDLSSAPTKKVRGDGRCLYPGAEKPKVESLTLVSQLVNLVSEFPVR